MRSASGLGMLFSAHFRKPAGGGMYLRGLILGLKKCIVYRHCNVYTPPTPLFQRSHSLPLHLWSLSSFDLTFKGTGCIIHMQELPQTKCDKLETSTQTLNHGEVKHLILSIRAK